LQDPGKHLCLRLTHIWTALARRIVMVEAKIIVDNLYLQQRMV
jgi:hypothetical protein